MCLSLTLELVLRDGKGHLQELGLLSSVHVLHTSGDGSAGVAAGVHDVFPIVVLGVIEESLDTGLREAPGAGVEGLLLGPDDGLGVGVHVEVLLELLPGEGVELLDTREGDVVDLVILAVLVKGGVDLASAQDDAVDLLGRLDDTGLVLGVLDDPAEAGVTGELIERRPGKRVTEERLREEDDKS